MGTNQDAPTSEIIPSCFPKTNLNLADLAAIKISPLNARPTPPPAAIPFIALMTGLGQATIFLIIGFKKSSILFAEIWPLVHSGLVGHPPPLKSAPEQKPLPSPVKIMDLTPLLEAASSKASITPVTNP